jgi:hypothetical protein
MLRGIGGDFALLRMKSQGWRFATVHAALQKNRTRNLAWLVFIRPRCLQRSGPIVGGPVNDQLNADWKYLLSKLAVLFSNVKNI